MTSASSALYRIFTKGAANFGYGKKGGGGGGGEGGGQKLNSILWYQTREVFLCVHMYNYISLELQVRTGSNLETRYRYHPQSQFNASAVRNNGL